MWSLRSWRERETERALRMLRSERMQNEKSINSWIFTFSRGVILLSSLMRAAHFGQECIWCVTGAQSQSYSQPFYSSSTGDSQCSKRRIITASQTFISEYNCKIFISLIVRNTNKNDYMTSFYLWRWMPSVDSIHCIQHVYLNYIFPFKHLHFTFTIILHHFVPSCFVLCLADFFCNQNFTENKPNSPSAVTTTWTSFSSARLLCSTSL